MTLASDQTSPSRRKGRRLCGAKKTSDATRSARACARVMGSYWKNRGMTLSLTRHGLAVAGAGAFAVPRLGPAAAARSERSLARRVAASMVENRQVQRRRLVERVSPKPSACAGAPIETGFGRSEVATKPDLKGNWPEHASIVNAITSDAVTRNITSRSRWRPGVGNRPW
jgi:hypothetical protein